MKRDGFTLVETLIAGVILSIGLLASAYTFSLGFSVVLTAQQDTIARQKVREAIESVMTGRNTENLTWAQIGNVSQGGVFVDGFTQLTTAGADGLVNTVDDGAVETLVNPGPDATLGTADDIIIVLNGYQRQVQITTLSPILKQIQVTIRYRTPPGLQRQVQLNCYVSPYI
jgi:prepilin-type N-terminal cleavage/methylation domain-containing protein